MNTEAGATRRTRKQWKKLVVAWRRSRRSAAVFASERGVVESTLRWWAWRLERDRVGDVGQTDVGLVPVRVVDEAVVAHDVAVDGPPDARVAWTLRTSRGEITVCSADESSLLAAVAVLVGGGP